MQVGSQKTRSTSASYSTTSQLNNNNDDNNNNNTSSSHQLANSMPLAPTHEIEMSDRRSTTTNDTKSKKDYGHKVAL